MLMVQSMVLDGLQLLAGMKYKFSMTLTAV